MPARTRAIKVVFFVLCLSLSVLQSGCGTSGGGKAEAPASDGNAVRLTLSTTSGSTAIVADGRSSVPIRLQVTNGSGTGMSGVPVLFATTAGTLSQSAVVRSVSGDLRSADQTATIRADSSASMTVTTDANGIAQVLLTAGTTTGTAVVTADALGFRANISIAFVPGPSTRVQLTASPTTVNASGTSTLTATVADAHGNAVPNETVTFSLSTDTSGATLSKPSGVTDSNGQTTVKYTAGTASGADTVRAQVTSPSVTGSVSITVIASEDPTVPSQIALLVSNPQLASQGAESVTLTALVRNALNNVVSGVAVQFVADSGSIQVINGTTGATGTAMALLTAGGDPKNRTITVTAKIGKLSSTNTVQVAGTTLTISGASTLVLEATTKLTILLLDSAKVGIPRQDISVSSARGNFLSATDVVPTCDQPGTSTLTVRTDVIGQALVFVRACVPDLPGPPRIPDTITALALSTEATATLSVSPDRFVFITPAPPPALTTEVPLNTPQTVVVRWEIGTPPVPQVGQTITFFATRGDFAANVGDPCAPLAGPTTCATTNATGDATVTISADNAGPAVISAVVDLTSGPSGQIDVEFIATTVASLVSQANPTTLGVNPLPPALPTQKSVITAVARDAQGNLVKRQTVSFSLNDVSGGQIFPASDVTDSFGRGSTVYTAGAAPSAHEGVEITTAVGTVTDTVKLTVAQQPLFVTLGTGNRIGTPTTTTYALPYSVLVTDADGNPVTGATVELDVLSHRYQKGFYVQFFDESGSCVGWTKSLTSPACQNEDSDFDGLLDPGEDFNSNGTLDPGNVATAPTSVTTDASGFAFFDVGYAREFTWVEVRLKARAVVAGSEGSSTAQFFLPGLGQDFSDCLVSPPGATSRYGIATTCSCDENTDATCPTVTIQGPVHIGALSSTVLSTGGGTFIFSVTGGTETSYRLTATAGTLSSGTFVFGSPPATLTTTANENGATIILRARDTVTDQSDSITLSQRP